MHDGNVTASAWHCISSSKSREQRLPNGKISASSKSAQDGDAFKTSRSGDAPLSASTPAVTLQPTVVQLSITNSLCWAFSRDLVAAAVAGMMNTRDIPEGGGVN